MGRINSYRDYNFLFRGQVPTIVTFLVPLIPSLIYHVLFVTIRSSRKLSSQDLIFPKSITTLSRGLTPPSHLLPSLSPF